MERIAYDEFGLFHENASEYGLAWRGPPIVRRTAVELGAGGRSSALVWGDAEPELVLVHGGAQNAHTWDTVALALGRPLVAVDLPGHGHSSWRDDGAYTPENLAADVAVAVERWRPRPPAWSACRSAASRRSVLAATRPDLVRRLVVVDVTPGTTRGEGQGDHRLRQRPAALRQLRRAAGQRTMEHNPTRSRVVAPPGHPPQRPPARRRLVGVALRPPRAGRRPPTARRRRPRGPASTTRRLWDAVTAVRAPLLLVRGSLSPVVDDDDVAELLPPPARRPRWWWSTAPATASRATAPSSWPR